MEETTALRGALRGAFGVGIGVDVDAVRGALQEARVLHGPAHDVDFDGTVREAVEIVHPLEPYISTKGKKHDELTIVST